MPRQRASASTSLELPSLTTLVVANAAPPPSRPVDASDILPLDVWRRVLAQCSLRQAIKASASSRALRDVFREPCVGRARFAAAFGTRDDDARKTTTDDVSPNVDRAKEWREVVASTIASERWFGEVKGMSPEPRFAGVGPRSCSGVFADASTATTFDADSVKIWLHGALDGGDVPGKRVCTLEMEKRGRGGEGKALNALAVCATSVVAGDRAGRLRVWNIDTFACVKKRAQAMGDASAISALCGVPNTSLVACASASASEVEIWDVEAMESVASVATRDGDGRDGDGVTCLGMMYGNSYGNTNRSNVDFSSRVWAGTTFDAVIGLDLHRAAAVDALALPEYARDGAASIAAIAVHGPLVACVARGVGALMWDQRGYPREQIVASFASPFERPNESLEQSSCIALEDYALWMSNPGEPGVSLFDIRKAFGPPRREQRWVTTAKRHHAVSILRPRSASSAEDVRVGCFARVAGSPGAVIVVPSADSDARCTIFAGEVETPSAESFASADAKDDGFKSRRSRQGKSSQPKSRGRYPKRGGITG